MTRETQLTVRTIARWVLGSALLGCGGGAAPIDAGLADAGQPCGEVSGPYGTSFGARFTPFELVDCAGEPYAFYGEDFCEAALTLVQLQAGWCSPCRVAAAELQAEIVEAYGPRGLRVLEILIQDNDYAAPDEDFCRDWATTYGLTSPVLIDADQVTQIYFPGSALPALVIVDSEGVIRYRQYGHDLARLKDAIEMLLAPR